MPIAKKYPLKEIFKAVDDYIYKTGRRVMFEYLMIKGVNDRDNDALALVELLRRPLYLLNLIPYNPISAAGKFRPSDRTRIEEFKKILETKGVSVTVRMSFGGEISAACGQLSGERR
jgi:23S rRNA (adenine2503-C2)-methyltransferase